MKTEEKEKLRDNIHNYLDRAMDKVEDRYEKVNVRVGSARERTGRK